MALSDIHELPLSELKIDPANVRSGDQKPDPAFIASIREKDLIIPLTVRKNGSGYLVTDGGKRLAALQELVKQGAFDKNRMVKVDVREDSDADAVDTSLTTNYIRTAMHPVAEYEAFAKLEAGGMTAEQIAKRYNISAKGVKQRLALGRLAPEVRAAWREDLIDEEAATAFTLEPDQKRQAAVLGTMHKLHALHHYAIKKELVGEVHEAAGLLRLVGIDAYRAAGGATAEDLFTSKKDAEIIATDLKLLKTLADKKLDDTVEKLKAEGWKWVERQSNLPHGADWWDHKPKNQIKADDRGKYGVIVRQNHAGDLDNHYGVTKPAEQRKAEAKAGAKGEATKAPTTLSNALKERLKSQLLRATAAALIEDTQDSGLDAALAKIVASQITPDRANYMPRQVTDGLAAVRTNITPKVILAAVQKCFDAKNYFSSAPRNLVLAAIKEAGFSEDQAKTAAKTKAEVAKFAIANVPKTGWLPKELRGPYYTAKTPAKKGKQ